MHTSFSIQGFQPKIRTILRVPPSAVMLAGRSRQCKHSTRSVHAILPRLKPP